MKTAVSSFLAFGGTNWLVSDLLPDNYDKLRFSLTVKLVTALVFFLIIVPLLGIGILLDDQEAAAAVQAHRQQTNVKSKSKNPTDEPSVIKSMLGFSLGGCLLVCGFLLLSQSPNNYLTARGVYQAPVFTAAECRHILDLSDAVAARNHQAALALPADQSSNDTITGWKQEPVGWHKSRHGNYPTTDLNLVIDPFLLQDREWLKDLLDRRLAPTLGRIYGIPVGSIRANDIFVVRYDAGHRVDLANHTDDADVSFNILLNEDFTAGGTVFWNRMTHEPFAHVQPAAAGTLLAHSSRINHQAAPIESGTRIILVGFLSVDRRDPFTAQETGLSLYASWLSLPWLSVRCKAGYLASTFHNDGHESYVAIFFKRIWGIMEGLGDAALKHHHSILVADKDAAKYLKSLDDFHESKGKRHRQACWFRGQQISLNFDGSILNEWMSRSKHSHRFEEL